MEEFDTETRPVWTGFKIAVRQKFLMHNKAKLWTGVKKGIVNIDDLLFKKNCIVYIQTIKKSQKWFDFKNSSLY